MGYALYFSVLILALLFIPFSASAASGAAEGAKLFAFSVFPALFPFFVCSRFLLNGKPAKKLLYGRNTAAYFPAFCASVLFGTPTSALISRELYASGRCGRGKASVICAVFNLSNPMFITAALAHGMAGNDALALLFAIAHYTPAIAAALVLSLTGAVGNGKSRRYRRPFSPGDKAFPSLMGAVSEAVTAILRVGGTIVFFKAVCSVLEAAGVFGRSSPVLRGVLSGILEFTGGLQLTAANAGRMGAAASAFVLSFGGACLYVQSKLFFEELSAPHYFLTKLVTGFVSAAAAWLLFPAIPGCAAVFGDLTETLGKCPGFDPVRLSAIVCGGISVLFSVSVTAVGMRAIKRGSGNS